MHGEWQEEVCQQLATVACPFTALVTRSSLSPTHLGLLTYGLSSTRLVLCGRIAVVRVCFFCGVQVFLDASFYIRLV